MRHANEIALVGAATRFISTQGVANVCCPLFDIICDATEEPNPHDRPKQHRACLQGSPHQVMPGLGAGASRSLCWSEVKDVDGQAKGRLRPSPMRRARP